MENIVKVCKIHGLLTKEMVYVHARKERKSGISTRCRLCNIEKNRRNYDKNREHIIIGTMKWKEKNKVHINEWTRDKRKRDSDKVHSQEIKRLYGVTGEQYARMLKEQDDKCAMCNQVETRRSRTPGKVARLVIDHCHETGVLRGLLCHSCNVGIGALKDSKELLLKAISYLERFKVCQ